MEGTIIRALSGFYYVRCGGRELSCRAKGKFRKEGITPLVGDRVSVLENSDGTGTVGEILPRRNTFGRPAVANVDCLVMVASGVIPVTDPYLIDLVTVRCEKNRCGVMLVMNKCDLDSAQDLYDIYRTTGYPVFRVSALTGQGLALLREALHGKTCCFTGNSGVGKSSILNALAPSLSIPTGDVSEKLGRGRHTTRHVELFDLGGGTLLCDTPGFSSFGDEADTPVAAQELAGMFPEFRSLTDCCRFDDCTHREEPGCAVRQAVEDGSIHPSRYHSYIRMYEVLSKRKKWELAP